MKKSLALAIVIFVFSLLIYAQIPEILANENSDLKNAETPYEAFSII
jgi:hypothetical protein